MSTIRDSSVFGFYFGSILVISSGHCCIDFFRVVFGVRSFTCGSLLFLSFVFVRGASHRFVGCGMVIFNSSVTLLRLTFAVSFLFLFLFYPQLVFSAALALRYRDAVLLNEIRLEP